MPTPDARRAALLRSLLEDRPGRSEVGVAGPVVPRQQEAPLMSRPSASLSRRIVELACRAPSFHNTQPWRWRILDDEAIELHADPTRRLVVADPEGRNLAISCGSALHHAEVAARGLGLVPEVHLAPEGSGDLLATISLSPGHSTPAALQELQALERRGTDRRRFTSWPIPEGRLTHLAEAAAGWGAYVLPVTDVTARFHAERLVARATAVRAADPAYAEDQRGWGDHTSAIESSDGLLAICTAGDGRTEWLHAGQALSALWLRAVRDGLSVVPLSQVIEVEETRAALHQEVFGGMARPQILVRTGWQEISRAPLPPTSRRPVEEVLLP